MLGQVGGTTAVDLEAKQEAWTILDELLLRAEPDSVLVSAAAVPFLERRFDLVAVAPTFLGQPAYRLGRFEVTGLRHGGRLATFVGRRPERALLQRRLDAVLGGRGQLVGIAGDAGIGKSRLLSSSARTLTGQGVSCLEGHCLSYATTVPYLPVLDLVRATCAVDGQRQSGGDRGQGPGGAGRAEPGGADGGTGPAAAPGWRRRPTALGASSPEEVKART